MGFPCCDASARHGSRDKVRWILIRLRAICSVIVAEVIRTSFEAIYTETDLPLRMAGPKPKYSYVDKLFDLSSSRSSEPT